MIILSGLLVIVAIALLVAGIVTEEQGVLGLTGLQLIYVSIAVSVVSALCLAIGVLIRRKELFGSSPARRPAAPKSRPAGRAARRAAAKAAAEDAAPSPEAEESTPYAFPMPTAQVPDDALVYVIPGRKRYHLDTCRQLAARQTEELTYIEAQEEGFSPCTACLPDTALAARATAATAGGGAPEGDPDDSSGAGSATESFTSESRRGFEPTLNFEAAPDQDEALPRERPGALPAGGMDWTQASSEPPAADTVTDWDPKALAADPLDPSYRLPEEAYSSGPNPLEPRRSGDSWSAPAPADTFWAKSGDSDSNPTPDQGTPLPESPLEESLPGDSAQSGSVLSEPVRPAADPEPETAPEPAAEEESLGSGSAHPVVPGSREPETASDGAIVRILSGTKRYHRPDCALIEDISEEDEDLETLSREVAKERGCTPCLVCQPDKEPAV